MILETIFDIFELLLLGVAAVVVLRALLMVLNPSFQAPRARAIRMFMSIALGLWVCLLGFLGIYLLGNHLPIPWEIEWFRWALVLQIPLALLAVGLHLSVIFLMRRNLKSRATLIVANVIGCFYAVVLEVFWATALAFWDNS